MKEELDNDAYLKPKQLAAYIHTTESNLANRRCAGKPPSYIKVGKSILYPRTSVESWLSSCLVERKG